MNPILFFPQLILWLWLELSGQPIPTNLQPSQPAAVHVNHRGF